MTQTKSETGVRRRGLLSAGLLGGMALPALAVAPTSAAAIGRTQDATPVAAPARRRLASLDVSSVGLGVQNMTRTYQTTVPTRPEMIRIIRRDK